MPNQFNSELKAYFETNPLAIKAASSIKSGRMIHLVLKNGEQETDYCFAKDGKSNKLTEERPSEPDVTFVIPEKTAEELMNAEMDSVGQVGLFIFRKILAESADEKIGLKLNCGILSFMTGGYLGVLKSGGGEVAKFLANKGLSSPGKIKDMLSRLKKA